MCGRFQKLINIECLQNGSFMIGHLCYGLTVKITGACKVFVHENQKKNEIMMLYSFLGKPAKEAFSVVARTISRFEPVVVGVCSREWTIAESYFCDDVNVSLIPIGSLFLIDVLIIIMMNFTYIFRMR